MTFQRTLSTFGVALALLVGGCGGETSPGTSAAVSGPAATTIVPATTVASTVAPTTPAPTTTTSAAPVVEEPRFPVTVVGGNGEVSIAAMPRRIVSMSGTHTEMLYAIGAGDQIAATDRFSNYPEAAMATPKVDAFNFNVEEVAALEPDLVILSFDFGDTGSQLQTVGIPYVLLEAPSSLDGMFDQLMTVGIATGHAETAADLAVALRERVRDLERRATPLAGVTFFHEVDDTLYTTTSSSFLGDLYARLGMDNIADVVAGDNPFPQLSPEFVLEQDPWLVFLGDANFGVTVDSVGRRPGWSALTAVVRGHVVPLDGDLAGRWGPRTVDLMEAILLAALKTVP